MTIYAVLESIRVAIDLCKCTRENGLSECSLIVCYALASY